MEATIAICAYNHWQCSIGRRNATRFGRSNPVNVILIQKNKGSHVPPRTARLVRGVIAGLLSVFLLSAPALATHEIDHRYVVWGEVLKGDGTPAPGETITFTVADGTPIGTVETNERGRYRVVLHVHDEDLGKIFDMAVGGVKKTVTIEFDPEDKVTERGKRVDFTIAE